MTPSTPHFPHEAGQCVFAMSWSHAPTMSLSAAHDERVRPSASFAIVKNWKKFSEVC